MRATPFMRPVVSGRKELREGRELLFFFWTARTRRLLRTNKTVAGAGPVTDTEERETRKIPPLLSSHLMDYGRFSLQLHGEILTRDLAQPQREPKHTLYTRKSQRFSLGCPSFVVVCVGP
jgi:hypothetical protein